MDNSSKNTNSSKISSSGTSVFSKTEAIAWCGAFTMVSVLSIAANVLAIVLFAVNRKLQKKCFFLVINMASADLMVGAVSLPIYIYFVGEMSGLWTVKMHVPVLEVFDLVFSVACWQATLIFATMICIERFYATYWPFKHKTLSMRAYRIVIFMAWTLVLLDSAILSLVFYFVSRIGFIYFWTSFTVILTFMSCSFNIAIWNKFENGRMASIQQNRSLQTRRLTNTLLFTSSLGLLSWIPISIMNTLDVISIPTNNNIYYMAVLLNVFKCCVNPVVYALRISEFRQALNLRCCRRKAEFRNMSANAGSRARRYNRTAALTPAVTQLQSLSTDPEVLDTKL